MSDVLLGLVGVGIIAGLLLLVAQIRANTRAIRAETFQALVGQSTRLLASIYSDPDVAELLARGSRGVQWEHLTPIQQARAHSIFLAAFRTFDNMLFQEGVGTVDERFGKANRELVDSYSANPLWREWFAQNRKFFSDELAALVQASGRA